MQTNNKAGIAPPVGGAGARSATEGVEKSTLKADIYNQFLRLKMKLLLIMLGF